MLVSFFFCLLLSLEELYHNQNLHSQIRRDVSRDQTSARKMRGKKEILRDTGFYPGQDDGAGILCVCFREDGPFIKSAEPIRMILVIHWSGRVPYSLPWVTYWPYIVEMEGYAFFVCLLFINLVLKTAGIGCDHEGIHLFAPYLSPLSLFLPYLSLSLSKTFFLSFRATEDLPLVFRRRDERDEKEEIR